MKTHAATDIKVKVLDAGTVHFRWALMLVQGDSFFSTDVVLSWHKTREEARKTAKEVKRSLNKLYPNNKY